MLIHYAWLMKDGTRAEMTGAFSDMSDFANSVRVWKQNKPLLRDVVVIYGGRLEPE
jgi:hypothetical protein